MLPISFEFFPPKTEKLEAELWTSIRKLEPLAPSFVSVTYGAGGTTQDRTIRVTERIARETGGRGEWPGGDGQEIVLRSIHDRPISVTCLTERIENPAGGIGGGEPGEPGLLLVDGLSIGLGAAMGMLLLAFYHPFLLAFDVLLLGGVLFVLLTFVGFILFELIRSLRIHPLQYLMVGLALAIFFRAIDLTVCETFPLGTHFLWHTLNAAMLGVALISVVRYGAPRATYR